MTPLTDLVARAGSDRRLLVAGVGIALVVGALAAVQWITAPAWVPAVSRVELGASGEMTDRLEESGIQFKLAGGGSEILVREEDLARARVALARDGLSSGARPGLELFDQQTWGWNDFTQRINYRRALEGELERTIGQIGGVERANVHIAIGERSAFRRAAQQAVTASVVLAMRGGAAPSADVVRGVAQLVSSSVDGLSADAVSVHDVTGRLWSDPADGSVSGLSARQLRMQREVETYLEQKAEAMVADVVGAGNARVRVSAALNFNRVERTTQLVDPARQALASEQKAEIIPGDDGGAASSNIANAYENSRSTELFSGAVGDIERLTVAVLVNEAQVEGTDGALPRRVPRGEAELLQLESLVRSAIGVNPTRGDAITVVSAPFERPEVLPIVAPVPEGGVADLVDRYQRPALNLIGILAVLIIGILVLQSLRASAPAAVGALTAGAAMAGSGAALAAAGTPSVPATRTPSLPPRAPAPRIEFPEADTQVRDRVVQTVEKDPDAAARLVKSWIKEG